MGVLNFIGPYVEPAFYWVTKRSLRVFCVTVIASSCVKKLYHVFFSLTVNR